MNIPFLPLHLEFESSTVCQMKCKMCPLKDMKRPNMFMSLDIVKKVVKELKEKGKGIIKTSYLHRIGEPTLNKDIFKIIDLVASAGVRTSISTNCILLKERKEEIFNSNLRELTLCLEGITRETYGKYRDKRYFDLVLFNIFDFLNDWSRRKSKIHVQLQTIRMRDNVKEIPKIMKTFSKFKSRGSFEILCRGYSTFGGRVEDLGEGKTTPRRFGCDKPWREASISVDGRVSFCCRDSDDLGVVGDVRKQSIYDIWHGNEYQRIRNLFLKKEFNSIELCRNC